jgi:hypothetical protein
MWGGLYNPVIPVDDEEHAKALVKLFRVDVLWPASTDPLVSSFISQFPHLQNPLFRDKLFVERGNNVQGAEILDIYHPILRLHDAHFKNNPSPEFAGVIYEWDTQDPLSDVWLATFGAVPAKDITGTDYLSLFEKYLAATRVSIGIAEPWPTGDKDRMLLSAIGRFEVRQHYSVINYWGHPGFYYGSSTDFVDLVNYWNLKAMDIHLAFYDPAHSPRFDGIRTEWLETLRSRPEGRFDSESAIAIWLKDGASAPDLSAFGTGLRQCIADRFVWNGLNVKAPFMYFSEGQSLATIGLSSGHPKVAFQLPPKPCAHDRWGGDQKLVISIDPGIGLFGNERATLSTPYIPELNEYYGRNYYFQWNKTRAEPDSIGIISSVSNVHLSVNALDVSQLIEKIFGVAGIVAAPSKPGLIASRLIQQMGGIQRCRPFKIEGVRHLIEEFGPDQSFTHSGAIQTIRRKDPVSGTVGFSKYEDIYIEQRALGSKLTPQMVLAYLMKKNVFRAGLEFDCPSCRLQFWTSLDNISSEATCEYCSHRFGITPYLHHRGDWRFRRSGLFGLNNHQEGAIPVVLLLQQLETFFGTSDMLYSTAMDLKPGAAAVQPCETDFVVVIPELRDGKIQLAIGECKTRKAIQKDDVSKLKAIAMAFPSDRFDVFVVLAKLTDFDHEEIEAAAELNDEYRRRAILLTSRELEPTFLYEAVEKEYAISSHAHDFSGMASTTHEIYFEKLRAVASAKPS